MRFDLLVTHRHVFVVAGPNLVVAKLRLHPAVIGKERRTLRRRKVGLRWTVGELHLVRIELCSCLINIVILCGGHFCPLQQCL